MFMQMKQPAHLLLWVIASFGLIGSANAREPLEMAAQGEYRGHLRVNGERTEVFAQIAAMGEGQFVARFLTTLTERVQPIGVMSGQLDGGSVVFSGPDGWSAQLDIDGQTLTGEPDLTMMKIFRASPTLAAPPPQGAVVLLGPQTTDLTGKWTRWREQDPNWNLRPGGAVEALRNHNLMSQREFGDAIIHVEYWQPLQAAQRDQRRGNSGVYVQGLYEVQILDSFGIAGTDVDDGAIYEIATPIVNMSLPPGQWQTLDIKFTAARMDGDQVSSHARMTVYHNGVLIHDDVEVNRPTRAAPYNAIRELGGVFLQGRCPIRFRNIWVLPQ